MFDRVARANRSAGLLGGVLTGMLAMLMVMAFAVPAFALPAGATPFSYSGKVVAIDHSANIVTVQAGPNSQQIFSMNDNATVSKCGKLESFRNLKVGDQVTIAYYQNGLNNNIAEDLSLMPSGMAGQHC